MVKSRHRAGVDYSMSVFAAAGWSVHLALEKEVFDVRRGRITVKDDVDGGDVVGGSHGHR